MKFADNAGTGTVRFHIGQQIERALESMGQDARTRWAVLEIHVAFFLQMASFWTTRDVEYEKDVRQAEERYKVKLEKPAGAPPGFLAEVFGAAFRSLIRQGVLSRKAVKFGDASGFLASGEKN